MLYKARLFRIPLCSERIPWINKVFNSIQFNGDRKSLDPRSPMSDIIYLCGSTNMILAWVSSRCVIKWKELRGSPADFSQRLQGIRQGVSTTALLWSFMLWPNEWKRWGFQGRKYLQFRAVNEYIITARASCTVSFSLPSNRFCAVREQITENPVLRSLLHGNACYAG